VKQPCKRQVSGSNPLTGSQKAQQFVERIIGPLVDFLEQQVGAESSVLYVLERYVRRVEWFDWPELHSRFSESTRRGEEARAATAFGWPCRHLAAPRRDGWRARIPDRGPGFANCDCQ
jgi:hypothetical protein